MLLEPIFVGVPEAFATLRSISLRWYCSPPRFLDPGVTADQADHAKFLGELRHTRPGKHTKAEEKIHDFIAGLLFLGSFSIAM
jgi:hypothetical protein